jgi:hypothetical protein
MTREPARAHRALPRDSVLAELSGVNLRRSYCQAFTEWWDHRRMHEGWAGVRVSLAHEDFADFPPPDRSVGDVMLWDARDVLEWADRHADAVGTWEGRQGALRHGLYWTHWTPVNQISRILERLGDSYDEETREFLRSLLDDIDEHWRKEHADEAVPGSEYLARVIDQVGRNRF